jgi:hypothetical protein
MRFISVLTLGFLPELTLTQTREGLAGDAILSGGVIGRIHLELTPIPLPEKYARGPQ